MAGAPVWSDVARTEFATLLPAQTIVKAAWCLGLCRNTAHLSGKVAELAFLTALMAD